VTPGGVVVVRASHLDLTGRALPSGAWQRARGYAVGQLDLPAAAAWAWRERRLPPALRPRRDTERAWLCRDDPDPPAVESAWFAVAVARRLLSPVRR